MTTPATAPSFFSEIITFLREEKKWWLTPIVLMGGLVGLMAVLGGNAEAPFAYLGL